MAKLKPVTIPITKFKAGCLSLLDDVQKTGRPIRVTRHGKPVADVVPAAPDDTRASWLGSMAGSMSEEDYETIIAELACHPLRVDGLEERAAQKWDAFDAQTEPKARRRSKKAP